MRAFVRSDLPELLVAGERVRRLVSRSSVAFALLAGIGADRLVGDVLRAIAALVLDLVRLEQAPRPYDLQQILGPAFGLLVARRAGGRAGAVAYLGYSAFVLALGWLGRALTCAGIASRGELGLSLGSTSFCAYGPLDLLAGALPLLIGLGVGALAARSVATASRTGANPLLEAAGAYAVPAIVFGFGAPFFVYQPGALVPLAPRIVYVIAISLISGVLAGAVAGLRSATPLRTAILLVAVLIATWLYPLGWSQFEMAARADWVERPEILLFALPLLDVVTIPLAARLVADATARSERERTI